MNLCEILQISEQKERHICGQGSLPSTFKCSRRRKPIPCEGAQTWEGPANHFSGAEVSAPNTNA